MSSSNNVQQVINFIGHHEHFVVLGHVAPDGDCIGSQLALTSFLRRIGKTAEVVSVGPFNKNEVKASEGLFRREILPEWQDYAVFIVDCSTFSRTGYPPFGVDAMSIDHHTNVESDSIKGFINEKSPSTTLLIQEVIETFGEIITEEEARWLFLGFATDTGFFRHLRSHSGQYMHQAAKLVDLGASPSDAFALLEGGYSLRDRQYLGKLLAESFSYEEEKIVLVEDQGLKDGLGAPSRDSDMLYRLLLSAEKTEVVIVLRSDDEQITAGLRSKNYVNVGEIAQKLGGGGHIKASGCTVKLKDYSVDQLKNFLIDEIKKQLI